MTPTFIKSLTANSDTDGRLIVAFNSETGGVSAADGPSARLTGVSDEYGADAGKSLDVIQGGWADVKAGANIVEGDELTSDANGRAVPAIPAAGETVRIIGIAQAEAVADDIFPVLISPGSKTGSA